VRASCGLVSGVVKGSAVACRCRVRCGAEQSEEPPLLGEQSRGGSGDWWCGRGPANECGR
jgi:hypothetical protein